LEKDQKPSQTKWVSPDVSGVDSFLGKNRDRRFFEFFFEIKRTDHRFLDFPFPKNQSPRGSLNLRHGFQKNWEPEVLNTFTYPHNNTTALGRWVGG
jgi:hypothetical protein